MIEYKCTGRERLADVTSKALKQMIVFYDVGIHLNNPRILELNTIFQGLYSLLFFLR